MLLSKTAVIKAASLLGLVCGTATTTYVAHKPIRKAVESVKSHVRHSPPKRHKQAPREPVRAPDCVPVKLAPQFNTPVLNVPLEPAETLFRPVPDMERYPIAEVPEIVRPFVPIPVSTGGGFVFIPKTPQSVPEPSTWALSILGFGVVGASLRSNKKQKARQ